MATQISLKAARVNANMTQIELAKALGVSKFTIINWESGATEPTLAYVRRISELSGIPMDLLFVPTKS